MNQSELFKSENSKRFDIKTLHNECGGNSPTGQLAIASSYLEHHYAASCFEKLLKALNWQQPSISMFGKTTPIPRKQVWMGDPHAQYRYSGRDFIPEPWNEEVLEIKLRIENTLKRTYNSVLCNLYADGNDSVSWHADDEPELVTTTPIASYSLGATRRFDLKPKDQEMAKSLSPSTYKIELTHNTLLVMSPEVQRNWVHQVPKTKKPVGPRINLTFREIRET